MKYTWILALQISFFGFTPGAAFAQALEETSALLTDTSARAKVIDSDSGARQADDQVKALGLGAEGEAKVYELSAKIFEKMSLDAGGDSEKLGRNVQALLRDPASLEKQISPEQKAQIRELSSGVSAPVKTK